MTDNQQTTSSFDDDRFAETDEKKLKLLKLERRQLRAALTRFETLLNGNPDLDLVSQRLERVKGTLTAFEVTQREIAVREGFSEDNERELEAFEDRYDTLLLRASRMIRPASAAASDPSRIAMTPDQPTVTDFPSRSLPQSVTKLPAISLPTFSGDYLQWEAFRDMYVSLVHANEGLTNVQRFHYLKSNLRGEALAPLENFAITDANYVEAWRELQDRYNNKRVLLNNHWHAFSSLAPITKESASALKVLFSGIARMCHALKSLDRAHSAWEDWLVYFAVDRLDVTTRRDWERSLGRHTNPPTFDALKSFVDGRIQALESLPPVVGKQPTVPRTVPLLRTAKAHHVSNVPSTNGCAHCKGAHYLGYCPKLLGITPTQRRALVSRLRVCFNCLRPGHHQDACSSTRRCSSCHERHHTILHDAASRPPSQSQSRPSSPSPQNQVSMPSPSAGTLRTHHAALSSASRVILATAYVKLQSPSGQTAQVRALLDPGSQLSFITENTVQTLRLPRLSANMQLRGVGDVSLGRGTQAAEVELLSLHDHSFRLPVQACVQTKVTRLPSTSQGHRAWPHLRTLSPLADSGPSGTTQIDLIIGADIYGALLLPDVRQGPLGSPTAQLTKLGWIIFGPVSNLAATAHRQRTAVANVCQVTSPQDISGLLRKFWELEEVPTHVSLSPEDESCEQHYVATHRRTSDGRYMVRLPLKTATLPAWTDSLAIAINRLRQLERRCANNAPYQSKYVQFMNEYQCLHHMQEVNEAKTSTAVPFYLPHHGVLRGDNLSGKLRVVFNASQRTSCGTSLNDHLLVGPTLQRDLVDVILSWRKYAIALTADIEKMYRQILVHEDDTDLQRIVWRENPDQPIRHFRLSTVTYGTACAPYLAIRTLMQLANDEASRFPRAAEVIRRHSYVDDILFGTDDVQSARSLRDELRSLLQSGGFELRKWSSNCPELLEEFPPEWLQASSSRSFDDERIKALGLEWSPQLDQFYFQVSLPPEITTPTKRSLLSTIAKFFDPVGWLAPAIITGKILIQDLWLAGVDWDTPLSSSLAASWLTFYHELPALATISIPRWIGYSSTNASFQLHGFADASSRAYAAVVYLRAQRTSGITVTLLAAKTKVAPVKQVSIPRLELCGAALLSRLVTHIVAALNLPDVSIHLWSDSQVVLAWLRAHPTKWTTFVANRVALIQCALPDASWRHVPTKDNPADVASRGISPAALPTFSLWWDGPHWLKQDVRCWPSSTTGPPTTDVEVRATAQIHATLAEPTWSLLSKYSSLTKLERITAWCRRFIQNCRSPTERLRGPLTPEELHAAQLLCITTAQRAAFADDIAALTAGKDLPRRSQLLKLRPFLDKAGVLRVGGRLQRSTLEYEQKHPAIIPRHSPLTVLLIAEAHRRTLHGGTQLTLNQLMIRFWVLGARSLVRSFIHRCTRCSRWRTTTVTPIMGNLPSSRVMPTRPFLRAGVDYAGPIQLRASKGRGRTSLKGYIALFICLWSKAIHLEAVSDCSTAAFLAAFQRFISRRGLCHELLSDNATTFHGADAELRRMFREASAFHQDIAAQIANDGTSWTFIPPSAPHFGGIWEAGVRSTKHHLRRVVGETTLTFEELTTVLAQVEACLNSRPLTPLSADPEDFTALTPGHFLVGEPLLAVPEPSTLDIPLNRLTRWQLTTRMRDHFWRRWSSEYLHQLQQRTKWARNGEHLQVGRLVLLKDDRLPPTKWLTGRVTTVHPGADGVIRVVTVRTATSSMKRPVAKLCPVPVDVPESS